MDNEKDPLMRVSMLRGEDGVLYWTTGIERGDLGNSPFQGSLNTTYFVDEKGSYIPCTAGHYHVHRGPLAKVEWWMCNCSHNKLKWMSKEDGLLMCDDCTRAFMVEEEKVT